MEIIAKYIALIPSPRKWMLSHMGILYSPLIMVFLQKILVQKTLHWNVIPFRTQAWNIAEIVS